MDSPQNPPGIADFDEWIQPSGDGAPRTPDLPPDRLEERLSAILSDTDRLEAVRRTALIGPQAEEAFDRFARLTSQALDVPVVLVSLIDDKCHYFKGDIGLPEPYASSRERPMAKSFCQYTVALGHPLVIEDAGEHSLVCDNPATKEFDIGGYMGVPLVTSGGHGIGNLCAIDTEPRQWTDKQLQALEDLATSIVREIEAHVLDEQLDASPEEAERKACRPRKNREAPSQ